MSLDGVNMTAFSQSAQAQNSVKQALIALFPKLRYSSITIVPKQTTSRRLEDGTFVLGSWFNRRLADSDNKVTFDIVITAIVQDLGVSAANPAAAGLSVFQQVASKIQSSVASGTFAQLLSAGSPAVLGGVSAALQTPVYNGVVGVLKSGFPTGQPSSRPTRQPSGQPTRQPSGQPTMRPSGQPTSAPSNPPTAPFILVDLDFVLQSDLPKGSRFNIFIPQVAKSQSQFPCTIVQRYAAMPIGRWAPYWFGANQTLQLTALVDFHPGPQSFTVGSADMVLKDTVIYQDDSSLRYSLWDKVTDTSIAGGVFDKVAARGLVASSLSFNPPVLGSIVSMRLGFTSELPMLPNDRVYVYLPGFSGVIDNTPLILQGVGKGTFKATWSARLKAILFTILSPVSTINVTIPSTLGLTMSTKGSNNYTGIPTIALRTHNWGKAASRGYQYFAPTPFSQFTPVAFLVYSRLSFVAPAFAGQETGVEIDLGYSLGIQNGDSFNITLPRFWSTSSKGLSVLPRSGGSFVASWLACSEVLTLTAINTNLNYSYFNVTVFGLRLPRDGVSIDLAKHFNVTIVAKSGAIMSDSLNTVQFVGRFRKSSLSFSALNTSTFVGYTGSAGELSSTLTITSENPAKSVVNGLILPDPNSPGGTVTLRRCSIIARARTCLLSSPVAIPASTTLTASSRGALNAAENSLNVTFELSNALVQNDVISVYLGPGVGVSSPTINAYNTLTGALLSSASAFGTTASWSAKTLSFTAQQYIPAATPISIVTRGFVALPSSGFPYSQSTAITISATAKQGVVVAEALQNPYFVGFKTALVYYEVRDLAHPVGLRFQFALSGPIVPGDIISFHLPFVTSTASTLSLVGDWVEESFSTKFSGLYVGGGTFNFTATASIKPLREVNIHIAAAATGATGGIYIFSDTGTIESITAVGSTTTNPVNLAQVAVVSTIGIKVGSLVTASCSSCLFSSKTYFVKSVDSDTLFTLSTAAQTAFTSTTLTFTSRHLVSAYVASLGTITPRTISYYPTNLAGYTIGARAGVNLTSCSFGRSCDLEFYLSIKTPIAEGEHLAISHPNLVRNANVNQIDTERSLLTLRGNSTKFFLGSWRAGDDTDRLAFASSEITVDAGGWLQTAADNRVHSVNLTLPSTYVGSVGESTMVVSTIPRIVTYYVDGDISKAICGDTLMLRILFTEPVEVHNPSGLKILMSTMESARYLEGNGSSTLVFVYNILSAADVTDLRVQGAGAVEFAGPAHVSRLGSPKVLANVTLSPPYGRLLRKEGQFNSISVTCAGSAVVTLVEQYVINPPLDVYRTGDIFDIRVTFDRPIQAVGRPSLVFSSNGPNLMVARYVNVSFSQWLDVYNTVPGGQFSLLYEGQATRCLDWNDTKSLMQELRSLSGLQSAMPLTYRVYALAGGIRYRLTFSNLAPFLLQVASLRCDLEASASVFLDPQSGNYSAAIFRYTVGTNDSATALTYFNTSSLVLTANNFLYVAGLPRSKLVNAQLPLSNGLGGLLTQSTIVVNSARPTIVQVYGNYSGLEQGIPAQSGQSVFIHVLYSSPVVVLNGAPLLLLQFTSFINGFATGQSTDQLSDHPTTQPSSQITSRPSSPLIQPTGQPTGSPSGQPSEQPTSHPTGKALGKKLFTRYVPFYSLGTPWARAGAAACSSVLVFEYKVQSGDDVTDGYLNYYSTDSLILNGSSILLASRAPSTPASLKLPSPSDASKSLSATKIQVVATQAPALMKISTDHPAGVYGVGEEILVYLTFSSTVHIAYNASTSVTHFIAAASDGSTTIVIKAVTSGIVASGMLISGTGIFGSVTLTCPNAFSESSDCAHVRCACTMSTSSVNIANNAVITATPSSVATSGPSKIKRPTVPLAVPLHAHMVYESGSATNTLAFKYTVSPGDSSFLSWKWPSLGTWNLTLAGGYFMAPRDNEQNNYWNYINEVPANLSQLAEVEINSAPPVVVKVDSRNADGVYYPGQVVDMTVVFNKKVIVSNSSASSLPSVVVDVPHFEGNDHIAMYSSGNGTTSLSFVFVVPNVPDHLRTVVTPRIAFDYAGTASLLLNGCTIKDATTRPSVAASYYLPGRSDSFLANKRNVVLQLTVPSVERVYTPTRNNTVITAGDTLLISVKFTQQVIVFHPPVLRLATGSVNRSATYEFGNGTNELVFSYLVQLGDSATVLDYVDTRFPPYNNVKYSTHVSLALNTDVHIGNTGRQIGHDGTSRSDDIVLGGISVWGGVFQATNSEGRLVAANTVLPLPGAPGSLSMSKIKVSTAAPFVTKVYTTMANGVYAQGVEIPIILRWDAAVVVSGCPIVIFRIQGSDHPATYSRGSGSTETVFTFTVLDTDFGSDIDYADRFSLQLRGCNATQDETSAVYIKRASAVPTVDANLTLPWVKYVESVIAPTSLSGSGNLISLSGSNAVPQALWTSQSASRTYSVGDIVDINVDFSFSVAVPNSTYMVMADPTTNSTRVVYYQSSLNSTTASFPLVVQADEMLKTLSYSGSDALRTVHNCDILDTAHSSCAAQNLPPPFSLQSDDLSSKNIRIASAAAVSVGVTAVEMLFSRVSLGQDSAVGTVLGVPISTASGVASRSCDSTGASWLYNEYLETETGLRILTTTGCPNHKAVCQKASCSGTDSGAVIRSLRWEIPLVPVLAAKAHVTNVTCRTSEVGVALNGVSIYSQSDETGSCGDAVAGLSGELDGCGGRTDSKSVYHYLVPPACLLKQLSNPPAPNVGHSPQVGWALDGFPVYGPYSVGGLQIAPCSSYKPKLNSTGKFSLPPAYCLDECNGVQGALPGVDGFMYRYYLAGPVANGECDSNLLLTCDRTDHPCCIQATAIPDSTFRPYSIGCFKGCLASDFACQQSAVSSGVVAGRAPGQAVSPTIVYNGSAATVQAAFNARTSDPQLYLPSPVWDSVQTQRSSALPASARVLNAGDVAQVAVTMSQVVYVEGRPMFGLQFLSGEAGSVTTNVAASFAGMLNDTTLLFELPIQDTAPEGLLLCSLQSSIILSGGRVMKAANFLPLLPAELSLGSSCCQGTTCAPVVVAAVYSSSSAPRVVNVTSTQSGQTFSSPSEVLILVAFSTPVLLVGKAELVLDLPGSPSAHYVRKFDSHSLLFVYTVREVDASASLEYQSSNALRITSAGKFDGIVKQGTHGLVFANLTLPPPGASGSLSREGSLTLDNDRPRLVGVSAAPAPATSGDRLFVTLHFDQPMRLVVRGIEMTLSQQLSSPQSTGAAITLALTITPALTAASKVTNLFVSRLAQLFSVDGSDVTFALLITPADPSGTVTLGSITPQTLSEGVQLLAVKNNAPAPLGASAALVAQSLSVVDNALPTVLGVSSLNVTAKYPWGTGDRIDIFVAMSLPVVVMPSTTPALRLQLAGRTVVAQFVPPPATAAFVTELHFRYIVVEGDVATPLEYDSQSALTGDVRRFSSSGALLQADLTLPVISTLGSLGFCCNVQIDTSRPYIDALIPVKHAGVYGQGEGIYVIARFNKPVVVSGKPSLRLNVGTDWLASSGAQGTTAMRVGVANFTSPPLMPDVLLDVGATDVFFYYVVRLEDNVASLTHAGSDAFVLPRGASVLHATTTPVVAADLTLRDPAETLVSSGRLTRQWKFNYAQRVDLLLRNLYHTEVSSLGVELQHQGVYSRVFSQGSNPGKAFGRSYPGTRLGNNATMRSADTGMGDSFFFSDSLQVNLALRGSAEQSSAQLDARLAIDGLTYPFPGQNSVSSTQSEQDPWWQVLLPNGPTTVQTVNIWPRQAQQWVYPLLALTMRGLEGYAKGSFRLRISDFLLDPSDPSGAAALHTSVLTAPMPFNVSAGEMKKAIEEAGPVGGVSVEVTALQQCDAQGAGCGSSGDRGYGFKFSITFNDVVVAAPNMAVEELIFLGGPVALAGPEKSNTMTFEMSNIVQLVRAGRFSNAAVVSYSVFDSPPAGATQEDAGSNQWLTPFTVMFFAERPPLDLASSRAAALVSVDVTSIDTLKQITLAVPVKASYVKIQRSGFGPLSFAEVEVFAERLNSLSTYARGSPISPSTPVTPYQPEQSFAHTFNDLPYDGMWIVQISQAAASAAALAKSQGGWSGALGTVGEAVLVVTDLVGITHAYYQDLAAHVTALPKHGNLSTTTTAALNGYGDWRDAFETTVSGELSVRPGGDVPRGICYGAQSSEQRDTTWGNGHGPLPGAYYKCPDSFGQGPLLDGLRLLGPTPTEIMLRQERLVVYQPRAEFLGHDSFTYEVRDGLNVQTHAAGNALSGQGPSNEVQLHVRNCRAYAAALTRNDFVPSHALCSCSQSASLPVGGSNATACAITRSSLCGDPVSRAQFLSMCVACNYSATTTGSVSSAGFNSAACKAETIRAVSFVVTRGLCSHKQPMDCSAEISSPEGFETFNFLSLGAAFGSNYFTALGDSFGGQGWYNSPPLA